MSEFNFLLARRSIYDPKMRVAGYQLLFQDPDVKRAEIEAIPAHLTCQHASHVFHEENMHQMLGSGLVFISFSQTMFEALKQHNYNFPLAKLAMIIDEKNIPLTDEQLELLHQLFHQRYILCISGYFDHPKFKKILEYATYYKLSAENKSKEDIKLIFSSISDTQTHARIFCENIDTHEMFEMTKDLGAYLFEGRFLNLPNLVKTDTVTTNRIAAMRLLLALNNPDISLKEVEDILSQDPRMSYKLLKIINSSAYGLPQVVNSIREAVIFLGLQQIRNWASFAIMSSVEEKPRDLLLTTMIRAKMCELIVELIGAEEATSFFTVGLFSTLDALLDKPMDEVLKDISLTDQVKAALLNREGEMGDVLSVIIAYENGNWEVIKECGLAPKQLSDLYLQSVNWASTSFKELKG